MGLTWLHNEGQTPIDEDEKAFLRIPWLQTMAELNVFEEHNIQQALKHYHKKRFNPDKMITPKFLCDMHHKMLGNVWGWAGEFRKSNKNLGVDWHLIPTELQALCNDVLFWIQEQTYSADEIAIRFKHRLVSIHCFPNGNGRHSRFAADMLISNVLGQENFTWGSRSGNALESIRQEYLDALRVADQHQIKPLLKFARS